MRYLSLFGALQAIGIYNQALMLAMGKPQWQTWLATIYALVNIVTFFFAVHYGLWAVAAAFTARAYLLYPLSVWPVMLLLPIGWRDYWRALQPSILASLFMALALWLFRGQWQGSPPLAMLLCTITLGAIFYAIALGLLGRTLVIDMVQFARARADRSVQSG
ncbi:polysaccharide biosynthesis C-terminal domain-containing protein [Sphingobium scionense]